MSQVEEDGRSYVYESREIRWCCTAASAVVRLLYCAGVVELQRKCGSELSLVVFRIGRPHNTHTRTHTSTVRSCHKTTTLKYRQCFTMAATASKAYSAIQTRQQRRQHSKNEQEQYQKFYMVY